MLEYVPARQGVHVDEDDAPTSAEYVPTKQDVHVDSPGVVPYVPG